MIDLNIDDASINHLIDLNNNEGTKAQRIFLMIYISMKEQKINLDFVMLFSTLFFVSSKCLLCQRHASESFFCLQKAGGPLPHVWLAQGGGGRCATSISLQWDDEVRDATLQSMLMETVARVTHDDPARGIWCVDENEFTVWVDASLLTHRVALAVDKFIIEDTCWLRSENNSRQHKPG